MARQVKRDAVIKRGGTIRKDRAAEERVATQDREITDDERVEMLRASYFQSALPDLPKIAGYHTIWLTTTNPRDTIMGRERLGYELLHAADFPGWDHAAMKGGQYDGVITVNEMVGAKIRTALFERFMASNHHIEPLRTEEQLVYENHQKKEELVQHGAVLIESPGMNVLGKDPGVPSFSDSHDGE